MSNKSEITVALGIVKRAHRISPNFVRITFSGDELKDFGTPGHTYDQRIKLIFPSSGKRLPARIPSDASWYQAWLALQESERGSMRTYSIRDLRVVGSETEVDIDFVIHMAPGLTGPASSWANSAQAGDEVYLVGPCRGSLQSGIEYQPGAAERVFLVGDETAAPAISRILEDAPAHLVGKAYIEIPEPDDVLPITHPKGVDVQWLPRRGAPHGSVMLPTVLAELGAQASAEVQHDSGQDLPWETPTFSSLGEEIDVQFLTTDTLTERFSTYYWIAGESSVVTTLRRYLIKDLEVHRSQVSFMGYWRHGVAMRG